MACSQGLKCSWPLQGGDEVSSEVRMAFIQVLVFYTAQLLLLQAYCTKGRTVLQVSLPQEIIVGFIIKMTRFRSLY